MNDLIGSVSRSTSHHHDLISKFYTTCLILMVIASAASIVFSFSIFVFPAALGILAKSAFIGATSLSAGWLTISMILAGRQEALGNRWSTPINFNVIIGLLCTIAVLTGAIAFLGVGIFTDMVFEGIIGATTASIVALCINFAKKGIEE